MIRLADRTSHIHDSITLAVSAKAAAMRKSGIDVISFGAGEPDFDTPAFIKQAAKDALDRGQTKYTPTPCLPELREAIARKFNRVNGLQYSAQQITTGAGGKFCLYLAMMATLQSGDEVIVPAPYWVSYPEQIKLVGATPTFIAGDEAKNFKITPQQLQRAITPRTRGMIINSPNNPTGQMYSRDELKALADVVLKHPQVTVFSDEIYESLVYDGNKSISFAAIDGRLLDQTITFCCHSKSFAMTGWRVGYAAGPQHVIDAMNRIQSQTTSHITSFAQMPAAIALDDPRGAESVEAMRKEFEHRGKRMWELLVALSNVRCAKPAGAFYCFPNISAYLSKDLPDAVAFAAKLLEKVHVAVVPGNDSGSPQHVRLSFATSMEQIEKGVARIAEFLKTISG